jgi:hypothetical protein
MLTLPSFVRVCAGLWLALGFSVHCAAQSVQVAAAASSVATIAVDAAPSSVVALNFRDFFKSPIGSQGLEISPRLQQAHGQRVRLVGYMVQQEVPTPGVFMLTPRAVQMSENADGDADDLPAATVLVQLDAEHRDWVLAHARGLIAVEGVLDVGREEGAKGRVSWVRLRLAEDALRGMNAFEVANYLHSRQHRH